MFLVEITTKSGKICERFRSYARAKRRIEQVPQEDLIGIPLIYQELPDGSQRLVREDGKPLQCHRLDENVTYVNEPLPLADSPDRK